MQADAQLVHHLDYASQAKSWLFTCCKALDGGNVHPRYGCFAWNQYLRMVCLPQEAAHTWGCEMINSMQPHDTSPGDTS